jgi:hypothetical protein
LNKLTIAFFAGTFSVAAALPCFAADSGWSGTWKENLAKSKLTGNHVEITQKPGGMMHFSNGSVSYDFACDGKPYTTVPGQTLTCTGNPQAGYDLTMSVNGHAINKQHRTFSADGKEMRMKGTDYRADGTTSDFTGVRRREGAGTGLVGTWVQAELQDQKPDVETWTVKGDTLQMQAPADKVTIDAKLDGTDTKVTGPDVPAGVTFSVKPEGANKLHYQRKLNGKVMNEGTYTLSADKKTMTEVSWNAGREADKVTIVYDKQ